MPQFQTLDEWIENAKKQFNSAMDQVKYSSKKKVRIKWKFNPRQIEDVVPDVETEFGATAEDEDSVKPRNEE